MKQKLFATGMGGCVGHYLYDELSKRNDLEFTFFLRSPEKVMFDLKNINVIKDDLMNINKYSREVSDADYVIHILADWGGEEGNYPYSVELFKLIDPDKVSKIIYFSTASILDRNGKVSEETKTCGTPYIRGKTKFHDELIKMPQYSKTVVLYPTWVVGGDAKHPVSHAYTMIKDLKKWIWLLSFFDSDLKFHFIHAKDIAAITAYLLDNGQTPKEYILGNKALTVGDVIKAISAKSGKERPLRVNLNENFVKAMGRLFDKKLTLWDKHCIRTYHQDFDAVSPSNFGLKSSFAEIDGILEEVFRN